MNDRNKYGKLTDRLPEHQVSEALWSGIEQKLNVHQAIGDKLPVHEASEDLWDNIQSELNYKQRQTVRKQIIYWVAAAAAVILFVLPFTFTDQSGSEQILTSEESVNSNRTRIQSVQNLDDDLLAYCTQNPDVCSSPDFNSLNLLLNELKLEKNELMKMSKQSNDPSINSYINAVNSNIVDVQRKLLSLF